MLLSTEEVCGSAFYQAYIPRFSVHIHRLRQSGFIISKRLCDATGHTHLGLGWLYRLEALPEGHRPIQLDLIDSEVRP
jgi:hypothetical protein